MVVEVKISAERYKKLLAIEKSNLESIETTNRLRSKLDEVKRRHADALVEIKRLKRGAVG